MLQINHIDMIPRFGCSRVGFEILVQDEVSEGERFGRREVKRLIVMGRRVVELEEEGR